MDHGLPEVNNLSMTGSSQRSCIAVHMIGSYDLYMFPILENSPRRVLNTKLHTNGCCHNFMGSSCTNAFWQLNIHSSLFRSPIDMCDMIISEWQLGMSSRLVEIVLVPIGVCHALLWTSCPSG